MFIRDVFSTGEGNAAKRKALSEIDVFIRFFLLSAHDREKDVQC